MNNYFLKNIEDLKSSAFKKTALKNLGVCKPIQGTLQTMSVTKLIRVGTSRLKGV